MKQYSLYNLNIGTYGNLVTAKEDTPVIEIVKMFVESNISVVPILNDEGNLRHSFDSYLYVFCLTIKLMQLSLTPCMVIRSCYKRFCRVRYYGKYSLSYVPMQQVLVISFKLNPFFEITLV